MFNELQLYTLEVRSSHKPDVTIAITSRLQIDGGTPCCMLAILAACSWTLMPR